MRPPLSFFVAGLPRKSPRPRGRMQRGFVQTYVPHDADDWKTIVRVEARKAWEAADAGFIVRPWEGPLCVSLTFYFPRPKSHFRVNGELKPNAPIWHTSTPDRDNLDKAVLDALTNLCIWGDDNQVCDGRIKKLYVTTGGHMGCQVEIKEAELTQCYAYAKPGELKL